MPKDFCDPLKIIDLVKGDIKALLMESDSEPDTPLDATTSADKSETEKLGEQEFGSQKSLAISAIGQRKVCLAAESACFIVEGSRGDKYGVTLVPTEKCQCPA